MIPAKTDIETVKVKPDVSIASGNRCNKAPPNKDPADKLTKNNNVFFNVDFCNKKNTIPSNETKETMITDTIV